MKLFKGFSSSYRISGILRFISHLHQISLKSGWQDAGSEKMMYNKSVGLSVPRRCEGVTFIELMLSLFFLNITILVVFSVMAFTLRSSQKLIDSSSGTLAAGQLLSGYIYNNPSLMEGKVLGEMYSEGIHFEYRIDVVSLLPRLKKVEAKVFWWSNKSDFREGYGKLYTSISTMVNEGEEAEEAGETESQ